MKRTLFYYSIALKSLIGFCDPITQDAIEAKIKEYSDSISSVRYYKNFQCPMDVTFKGMSQDYKEQCKMEENFFQNFSQGEIAEFFEMIEDENNGLLMSQSTAFEKYSRELDEQGIENLPEYSVRIIDFESIINGFNNQALKCFAEELKSNDEKLKETLTEWIKNKEIFAYFKEIPYIPKESIQKECKANMSKAIKKLLNYPAGRETLILVLCIEKFKNKTLKIFISNVGPCISSDGEVYLEFLKTSNVEAQSLYHEFNHWIHYTLGIFVTAKITGDFLTDFEKNFLQLKDQEFYRDNITKIEENIEIPLNESSHFLCEDKEKTLKIFDIQTTWSDLEELWNIAGFANINNVIYINRLSDMDLVKQPVWGHFTRCDRNIQNEILIKMYEEGPKTPTQETWETWLKLHKLSKDTKYLFYYEWQNKAIVEPQNRLFNIPEEISKIKKEYLLEDLLYTSNWECINWEWADVLLKNWKEENPELFEKIDDLKIQAQNIMSEAIDKRCNMIWGDK